MKVDRATNPPVVPLISVGSIVETSKGSGEIIDIVLQVAKWDKKWELEPPTLVVLLEDGMTINTCLCSIEIPESETATKILHSEYKRLWPPVNIEGVENTYDDESPPILKGRLV